MKDGDCLVFWDILGSWKPQCVTNLHHEGWVNLEDSVPWPVIILGSKVGDWLLNERRSWSLLLSRLYSG